MTRVTGLEAVSKTNLIKYWSCSESMEKLGKIANKTKKAINRNGRKVFRGKKGRMEKSSEERGIKVISFDLDNTLWDNDPVVRHAMNVEATHIKDNYPVVHKHLVKNPSALVTLRSKVGRLYPGKIHELNFIRKKTLQFLGEDAGIEEKEIKRLIQTTFTAFDEARQLVQDHFYPGVLETLGSLKKRGFTLVANTNGTAQLEKIPEIRHVFDYYISAQTAGALKPNKAPFEKILDLTKVCKEQVLHVGDNIVDDVRGSVDFGMKVVWINERYNKVDLAPAPTAILGDPNHAGKYLVACIPSVVHMMEVLKHLGNDIQPSL